MTVKMILLGRRHACISSLAAGLASLLSTAMSVPALARSNPGGHSISGGIGGIVRANYTVTPTSSVSGIGTIFLPDPNTVYLLPLSVTNFAESADFTLESTGLIQINTTGFYRVSLNVDWPGQHGTDTNLRYYGIGRVVVGQPLTGKMQGDLYDINSSNYDQLAVVDIPGSDPPVYSRASVSYSPGTIQPGSYATLDVSLPQTGIVDVGDFVNVSDTALTDAALTSAGNNAIALTGRVIGPDKVRIFFDNTRGSSAVQIPTGTIEIIAGSSINTRGQSADAWAVIQTPTVLLYAGEQIFGVWKSKTPGDFLQTTNQTYLQIELIARKP